MSDDIVARLRVWSTWLDERVPDTDIGNDLRDAADEIERLRREVTQTQLNACYAFARRSKTKLDEKARWYAKQMGWDCFTEAK